MVKRQRRGEPVHTWDLAALEEGYTPSEMKNTHVEDYMSTDLFTVHEEESIEFVARLMDWQTIRHVLVEDEHHGLVGLVSHRTLLRHLAEREQAPKGGIPVKQIMIEDPISVPPDMATREAVQLMRKHQIGALPVVREGQLVGIITESDFIEIAGNILDDTLGIGTEADDEHAPVEPLLDTDEERDG
jgi:CBS domain-containing protein